MNTLVAVAIAPFGQGEELSQYVAEVVDVIRASGLKNRTYSMFTEIEGEWDEVMDCVKRATFVLAQRGIRTEVVLKADIRPGYEGTMDGKLQRLEEKLQGYNRSSRRQSRGEGQWEAGAVPQTAPPPPTT